MNSEEFSRLTDEELIELAKNNKPKPIVDAFLIGSLIGIIFYSVVKSTWGLVTIIPLFLLNVFLKKPKKYQTIEKELKARNLKL